MKQYKLLFIGLLSLVFATVNAQVSDGERSMINGVQPALSIVIPNTDDKDVAKWWKDYLKDYKGKAKKVKKGDEFLAEGVKIVDINGANPIDIYGRTDESGNDAEQIVWFDLGGGNYLNSASGNYSGGEKFMLQFGLFVTKKKTELELKAEEKTQKGLEADLKKLEKDNESYHNNSKFSCLIAYPFGTKDTSEFRWRFVHPAHYYGLKMLCCKAANYLCPR